MTHTQAFPVWTPSTMSTSRYLDYQLPIIIAESLENIALRTGILGLHEDPAASTMMNQGLVVYITLALLVIKNYWQLVIVIIFVIVYILLLQYCYL